MCSGRASTSAKIGLQRSNSRGNHGRQQLTVRSRQTSVSSSRDPQLRCGSPVVPPAAAGLLAAHVYMYICIHVYMYTCIHVCMYTCIHVYTYTHMYMYLDISAEVFSLEACKSLFMIVT